MTRRTAYALIALAGTLVLLGMSLWPPKADALPIFQHTSAAGFTDAHCLPSGAWAATLTITGTNPELHPTASITVSGQPPLSGANVPYTGSFTAEAVTATMTATAKVTWSDGFTQNLGPYVANRPDGCTPPTTTVPSPTTTTCAGAIPPRTDCGAATTVPPTPPTTLPAVASSVVRSPDTTVYSNPPSSSGTPAPEVPPAPRGPATTARLTLPVTGGPIDTLLWITVIVLAVGLAAGVVARAKRQKREEG